MTRHATRNELALSVGRLARAMNAAHLLCGPDNLALQHGSKRQGVSYQLYISTADGTSTSRPFGSLHFGFTASDCERTLDALAVGIEATIQGGER